MLFLELTVEVVEALRGVADTREKSEIVMNVLAT